VLPCTVHAASEPVADSGECLLELLLYGVKCTHQLTPLSRPQPPLEQRNVKSTEDIVEPLTLVQPLRRRRVAADQEGGPLLQVGRIVNQPLVDVADDLLLANKGCFGLLFAVDSYRSLPGLTDMTEDAQRVREPGVVAI
jgi:hypothetical protein